jgi:hypothetical protein
MSGFQAFLRRKTCVSGEEEAFESEESYIQKEKGE